MRNKQRGVTLIGWLVILAIIGVFALATMRLVPVYLESMKVSAVMRSTKAEHDGNRSTVAKIRKSIQTRFSVEGINIIKHREVKITPAANGAYLMQATYKHETPFIGNLGLIVSVDHRLEIAR
ncbi:MAG: DUF4845 domain-containing protein [Gammaproteobacteria bacterium]|nr:DUF4845 domain-containing protein [Gammaproteobacteria bacterium]MDH3768380.1 DUF4845 domain-containing protein [Gammaproteobacteria bacterium]